MAFDITAVGGYGTGSLGNFTVPYTEANGEEVLDYPDYLQTYLSHPVAKRGYEDCYPNNIYPDGLTVGGATLYLDNFSFNREILPVGSAMLFVQMSHKDEANEYGKINENLADEILNEYGRYEVRTITAIDGNNITFDQAPSMDFANYYVQIVPVLDFENLTLNSGGQLSLLYHWMGEGEEILAVRVKNTLTLNGGHINLFGDGSQAGNRRLATPQERNAVLDTDEQAGQENSITKDRFLLSGGYEGGLFLIAKNIVVTNPASRIGVGFEFTHGYIPADYYFIDGVQYCRGASDSPNRPTDLTITFPPGPYEAEVAINGVYATNKSGATILIACETFEGFTPALIAKYSMGQDAVTDGQFYNYGYGEGLGRCYIACKNPPVSMLHDEGLYALDVVTDGDRLRGNRVYSFGNGQDGDATNPSVQINSYAAISGLSSALATLTNESSGSCPIEAGALVMIHAMAKTSAPENVNYVTLVGAAALSNPHIQTAPTPSGEDTEPSGEDTEPSGEDTVPSGEDTVPATGGVFVTNTEDGVSISGTEGADTILTTNSWEVTIDAGGGADSIYAANDSCDSIKAGGGNDTIKIESTGNSTIEGGAGDDEIKIVDSSESKVEAGEGNDTIKIENSGNSTIDGGAGNDEIKIVESGDSKVEAGEGNDTIKIEKTSDSTIDAGAGNDSIKTENAYSSKIDGGAGDDYIENHSADDSTIYGGAGNDTIKIDSGWFPTIDAGAGNDVISLNNYYNEMIVYHAGDGNDTIYGFHDWDTLSIVGGSWATQASGEDILVVVGDNTISMVGAANLEEFFIEPAPALQSKAKNLASKALTADNIITNREDNVTVYGTAGDDTIANYGSDVTIFGGGGNDEIRMASGSARAVIVVGFDEGTNTYVNLGSNDTILVSLNGEEYQEERTSDYVTIRLQSGASRSAPCINGNVVSVTGGTLVEEFSPPEGWIYNTANNVSVQGTSGDDSIYSGGTNVTIIPNAGSDIISLGSNAQNNVIVRRFNDGLGEYYGLDGNDTILISLSGGTYWEQRENNFVRIHYGNVIRSEPCTAGNVVSVVGATKIEHPSESLPSDWIVNRADNVSIYGSDESDTIANYGSNCTIYGGKGDDTISMASGSNNNVVITGFYGRASYVGLNSTDTILVTLNGGGYFSTVETEDDRDYRAIYYNNYRLRIPISSGNAVSVTGGVERDYILIKNTQSGSTILGGEYPEYIINSGTSVRISCGGGNDTVENHGRGADIDVRSGANVVNNYGNGALIHSSNGQNEINQSGSHSEIYFSGSDTISIDGGAKYNNLVARWSINQAVVYGFNGTTTLSYVEDYTLTEAKPDLRINLDSGKNILLKDVYNNTGVIHIGDEAIAISPDDYTYNYEAGEGDIAISGFNEDSTLNVTGNFIWERHGNDIIVGVSENDTPIIYTGDISPLDYPRDSDFKLAKVMSYSNGQCSLDTTFDATPDDYYLQLISIPQYKNFTLSNTYTGTPKWENGRGGICALAVNDTCNLSGGELNVEGKGHGLNVGNELDGNAFMRNHLPLGNGHGSVFLLAKNIRMNTATRIGATSSGALISNYANYGGKRSGRDFGSKQGAHVLIVADKITGLTEAAISTGGDGAGAGYCGADGVGGAAFICCNSTE